MATTVVTFVMVIETSGPNMEPSVNFTSQKVLGLFPHGLRNARVGSAMYDEKGRRKWTHIYGDESEALRTAMDSEFGPEDEGPKVA
jgi:hypothetical protein